MYKLVSKSARIEIVINKSRFIGTSFSCLTEEEAKEKVAKIKKEYSDATHNCYAYIFDNLGNALKFSDDGEPQGTAGMPILEVIRNQKLVNSGVVVTRYFGGIKLGAGGLVRAYTECAALTLKESEIAEMTESITFKVKVDYSLSTVIERYFDKIERLNVSYEDIVTYTFIVKDNEFDNINKEIFDKTLGKAKIEIIEKGFYPFKWL